MAPLATKKSCQPLTMVNLATNQRLHKGSSRRPMTSLREASRVVKVKAKVKDKVKVKDKAKVSRIRQSRVTRGLPLTKVIRPRRKLTPRSPRPLTNPLCLRLVNQLKLLRHKCISHQHPKEWRLKPAVKHPSQKVQHCQLLMLSHLVLWLLSLHIE